MTESTANMVGVSGRKIHVKDGKGGTGEDGVLDESLSKILIKLFD